MGKLDVHISHGGGSDPKAALLVLAGLGIIAFGGSAVAAATTALTMLLVLVAVAVGITLVGTIALAILFRKRLFAPQQATWHARTEAQGASPAPQQLQAGPREVHTHTHYHLLPGMLPPAPIEVVQAEVVDGR